MQRVLHAHVRHLIKKYIAGFAQRTLQVYTAVATLFSAMKLAARDLDETGATDSFFGCHSARF